MYFLDIQVNDSTFMKGIIYYTGIHVEYYVTTWTYLFIEC